MLLSLFLLLGHDYAIVLHEINKVLFFYIGSLAKQKLYVLVALQTLWEGDVTSIEAQPNLAQRD